MKILYIFGSYSGLEDPSTLQVLYMCNAFSKIKGVEIKLAFSIPNHYKKNLLEIIEEKLGCIPKFKIIEYKNNGFFGKLKCLTGYKGIKNIIIKNDYDVIFTRLPLALIIAINKNKKVVFEYHDYKMHNTINLINRYFQKKLICYSKKINFLKMISISQSLMDKWISEGVPKEKSLALHDAISVGDFTPIRDRYSERRKLKLPIDKKIITYVGTVDENRGIENIIKLAGLNKRHLFIVVGGNEYNRSKYSNIAASANIKNIIFVGFIPHNQIYSYLFSADVLLLVFDRKIGTMDYCSPIKLFEYMAAGRIIVGQNFPTISEVLTNNKDSFLADPVSLLELNQCLKKALELEYPNLIAKNAREKAFKYYTWTDRANIIINEIKKIDGVSSPKQYEMV